MKTRKQANPSARTMSLLAMSTEAFSFISKQFAKLIEDQLPGHPRVVLEDPGSAAANAISLWLYQVTADEFLRNAPPQRMQTAEGKDVRFKRPALGVNLFYLLTPMVKDPESQQNQLAQTMLLLHENPTLRIPDPSNPVAVMAAAQAEVDETVSVSLAHDSHDERARVWDSIDQAYRLSLVYQVRTVRLISKQIDKAGKVQNVRVNAPPAGVT